MKQFVQCSGESKLYQQAVLNDTIQAVTWTVNPSIPTTLSQMQNTDTAAQVMVTTPSSGTFVVVATMTLASGQTIIGEAMIIVVDP